MAIDKCVENFSDANLKAQMLSTLKCRPRDDPRPLLRANIQDEIRLKYRLRRTWKITRDTALKAKVKPLKSYKLIDWRNDQWSSNLESFHPEDQSLCRMTKRVMRFSTPSPLVTTGGTTLSDSEKSEALADNLETSFQPVTDPSARKLLRWLMWCGDLTL
jgi:hypothetical protein